jgi:hypothetical protein
LVSLFIKYNPLKYIPVLLVLLAIRLIAWNIGLPMMEPEVTWFAVGERMSEGFMLYKEIWTELEPLSAFVYYVFHLLTGKSELAYFIVSLILVFGQAVLFNYGLNANRVLREPTSLPAYLYVLFSSLFFDFYTLSPALMATTFMIGAFNLICAQSRTLSGEDRYFYIGLLIGLASVFYVPYTIFLLFAVVSLGLYSNTTFKKQITLVMAFCFPNILVLIYFFWANNIGNYYQFVYMPLISISPEFLVSISTLAKILLLPFIVLFVSIGAIVSGGRYIHYQYKVIKIVGLWLLMAIIAMLFEKAIAPQLFILFVFPFSFFSIHLFLALSGRKWINETVFTLFFGGIIGLSFYTLKNPDDYTVQHFLKKSPSEIQTYEIKNKRILVLGPEKEFYIENTLAGPYLNWGASVWLFDDLGKYYSVSELYEAIEQNKPEYIVDSEDRMKQLILAIPVLASQYKKMEETRIFHRVGN